MAAKSFPIREGDITTVLQNLRANFIEGKTRSYEWRLGQLKALRRLFLENTQAIVNAVKADLGKHETEILASEYNMPLVEIEENISHLASWMQPESVGTTLAILPGSCEVYKDPFGVALIMSPWNYPVNLGLVPLAGAIAAGNCVFVKLSRHSRATGKLLEELLNQYMDTTCIVAESDGGASYITALLKEQWDYIFFTGSVSVGKVVYEAAAKHLTPVTLELGGKNPCIVDREANVDLAAKRIVWGKFWNCAQTCITTDYILCHKDVQQPLIEALKKYITKFFGEDPQKSASYARIISKEKAKHLSSLFAMGKVEFGGKADVEDRYVAPTIITNPDLNSALMTDEIFGPLLPIHTVSSIDEAIDFISKRPLPLSLYIFSNNKSTQEEVLGRTRSGAAGVNDLLMHFTNSDLPFGGVGASGLGSYHGKRTFNTFTHERAVVKQSTMIDVPLRYPPYGGLYAWLADKATSGTIQRWLRAAGYVAGGAILTACYFNADVQNILANVKKQYL